MSLKHLQPRSRAALLMSLMALAYGSALAALTVAIHCPSWTTLVVFGVAVLGGALFGRLMQTKAGPAR